MELASELQLPPTCPGCGLAATIKEFTTQRLAATKTGRQAITITVLSWFIALMMLGVLLTAVVRLIRQ
jgi:hypothetical protein